ncbi:hemocyanin-like 1 (Hcl-1), partial [Biomphalaria glabrata]
QRMKLLVLVLVALAVSTSANVIRDERDLGCIQIMGINPCAIRDANTKKEEDLNIAEIVADIGKVVHVIDGFVGGAAAKREDIVKRPCIQKINIDKTIIKLFYTATISSLNFFITCWY